MGEALIKGAMFVMIAAGCVGAVVLLCALMLDRFFAEKDNF